MAEKKPAPDKQPPPEKKPSPRFSIKRIAFHLRRPVTDVKPFTNPDTGVSGHVLKTEGTEPGSTSLLSFTDGREEPSRRLVRVRIDLPGDVRMTAQNTPENGRVIFTHPDGSVLTYNSDGSITFYPHDAAETRRIQQLKETQEGLPWWEQDKELVDKKIIDLAATIATDPEYGQSTKNNTAYGRFEIAVEGTDKRFDVYAYEQGLGLLKRRKVSAGEDVYLRASVNIDRQFVTRDETRERRWLRLFNVR